MRTVLYMAGVWSSPAEGVGDAGVGGEHGQDGEAPQHRAREHEVHKVLNSLEYWSVQGWSVQGRGWDTYQCRIVSNSCTLSEKEKNKFKHIFLFIHKF